MPSILLRKSAEPHTREQSHASISSLLRQGFSLASTELAGDHLIDVGHSKGEQNTLQRVARNDWKAIAIGPVWTKDGYVQDALLAVLADLADQRNDLVASRLRDLRGSFVLIFFGAGQLWIYCDPIGGVQLFRDAQSQTIGSSFLSLLEGRSIRRLDRCAVLHYLLSESPHGRRSLIEGIELIPPGHLIALHSQQRHDCWSSYWKEEVSGFRSPNEAVDVLGEILTNDFRSMVRNGFSRASVALSGGFDSRLVLALTRRTGIDSRVFVYGQSQSLDVRIAQRIGEAEQIAITQIDKRELDNSLKESLPVETNMDFFDGFSADGFLDRGADRLTRLAQSEGGRVILNGGGGEVLRNFFRLGPGNYSPRQIIAAFYSQFPSSILRSANDLETYRGSLAEAIGETHSSGDRALDRTETELLYPLFRCRWWMSRNSSIANRTGAFLTPLLNPEVIRHAATLNLDWKRSGALEAALISHLDPSLAKHESAYGFSFSKGPGATDTLREKLHELKPLWARPKIAALNYRLKSRSAPAGGQAVSEIESVSIIKRSLIAPNAAISESINRRITCLGELARRFNIEIQ